MVKAAATKSRKKRPRKPPEEDVYYVIAVESWEWSYYFSINRMKDRKDPYSDYRHLHLFGTLLRPLKSKAKEVRLVFLPNDAYNSDQWHRHHNPHIGTLSVYRGRMEGLFYLASDVLPMLLTMLTGDRIKFVVINGKKLHYGRTDIDGYRFECALDEDDLPPDTS